MKYICFIFILLSSSSFSMNFSDNSTVTVEQANTILKNYKFNEKELSYRVAFTNFDLSEIDKMLEHFYDPESSGTLSSKDKIREAIVDCNIYSYQGYSEKLRNVPFNITYNGGSYPDAKMAFDIALAAAVENPKIGKEKVLSMIQGASDIFKLCTNNHGMNIIE